MAHLFGWNTGTVESFYIGENLWTGFRCNVCQEINHAQESFCGHEHNLGTSWKRCYKCMI